MKKLISIVLLLFISVTCLAQQKVIIQKEYYTLEYDDDIAGSNIEYFGWSAFSGATESQAVWRIMRITYSGTDFIIQWADGNQNFDNKWENRATLSYE